MIYYVGDIPYGQNELYHHGVKGMKWGVRRYQNSDGSLTAAGRARYNLGRAVSNIGKAASTVGKAVGSAYASHRAKVAEQRNKKEASRPKKVSELTDQELRQAIDRMRNEKAYNDLIRERSAANSVRKGAKTAGKLLSTVGSVVLKPFAAAASKEIGVALGKSIGEGLKDQQQNNKKKKDDDD